MEVIIISDTFLSPDLFRIPLMPSLTKAFNNLTKAKVIIGVVGIASIISSQSYSCRELLLSQPTTYIQNNKCFKETCYVARPESAP